MRLAINKVGHASVAACSDELLLPMWPPIQAEVDALVANVNRSASESATSGGGTGGKGTSSWCHTLVDCIVSAKKDV